MKTLVVSTAIALAALASFPGESALAAPPTPVLDLGPGYIHEDGRLELDDIWEETLDKPAYAYGFVGEFHGALADLQTSNPEVEYTWVVENMVSAGVSLVHTDDCDGRIMGFKNGRFRVLRDVSRDAGVGDPATFADGEILLEADLVETNTDPYFPLSLALAGCDGAELRLSFLKLSFVGGTRFKDISPGGEPLFATGQGWFRIGNELPWSSHLGDYFADMTATVSVYDTVPVRETTWGRIKTLYD